MTDEDVHQILQQVTGEILDRMRRTGFRVGKRTPRRYDPLPWDISNGHCEEWAKRAADLIPGAFPQWVDPKHCVLVYDGRFYDADRPGGVTDMWDLPMLADPALPRPEP